MERSFDPIFKAKSIAVYGASSSPVKVGGRPLRYLREQGYAGEIYPINPNYDTVQGLRCYHTVEELPKGVDLVIIAVPAGAALEALRRCVKQGIKAAVVLTAGFSEAGPEGRAMQEEMKRLAQESGMIILGPNCLGVMNITDHIPATFATVLDDRDILPGEISLISQSGAFGAHILGMAQRRKVGFRYWVTTGNEVDLQLNDCVEYAARDEHTAVIASYVEDARDGEKFMRALDVCLEEEKPVVMMKVGRTSSGAKAAMSHTGALAGDYQVYEALFRQKGVIQANNLHELLDFSEILTQKKQVNGNRIAIITVSGGAGVMMTDRCEENGLALARLLPETEEALKGVLPAFAAVKNPVDVTAQAVGDPALFGRAVGICLQDPGVDVMVIYLGLLKSVGLAAAEKIAEVAERSDKPVVVTWVAGPQNAIDALRARRMMVFEEPIRCIEAVSRLVRYRLFVRAHKQAAAETVPPVECGAVRERLRDIAATRKVLSEHESRQILQAFGIPVVRGERVYSAEEAVEAAGRIGYPVVVKINSHQVPHKSDAGGVRLNLRSAEEVREAYDAVVKNVRASLGDGVVLDGVLVQRMERCSAEALIGVKCDPKFGPAVAFGLGGIFVEVFQDASLRIAPVGRREAEQMIGEIRGKKILDGARGGKRTDQAAVAEILTKVSQMAYALRDCVAELDINPLFVFEDGCGAQAGDALIVLK